jgi:endonuclease YncB( thermonuclease family)
MHPRLILTLSIAAGLCACTPSTQVSGYATVVDGDSLNIAGTSIRLHGVDAPEGRQSCTRDGARWACGDAAAEALEALVAGRTIVCTEKDIDQYGRTVAQCTNGEADLGAELVRSGLALAYRQYSSDYVGEEAEAKSARRGVWAGTFTPPWEWRRHPRDESPAAAPAPAVRDAGCLIKGNINRAGERIYHVPGSRSYEETLIDEARGERWFCSEAEAQSAGWRAPRG